MADGARATVIRVRLSPEGEPFDVTSLAELHAATNDYPLAQVEHDGRWIPKEKKFPTGF